MPSLSALRAFEAVARRGSFKDAAEELFVTPGALSQQVRKLEEEMGVRLLERQSRGVVPTDAGHRLRAGLSDAFGRMREAVEATRPTDEDKSLVVSCGPPFAAKWLAPRLGRFMEAYPEVDIRLAANFTLLDFSADEIDIGIRLSLAEEPGLVYEPLFDESVLVLASPSFVEAQKLKEPRDLLRVPIITDESLSFQDGTPNWASWLAAVGLPTDSASRGLNFGMHAEQAIDAAVSGAGVVLGRRILSAIDIAEGRLVSPFGPELETGVSYRFACRESKRQTDKVVKFRAWLQDEMDRCDRIEAELAAAKT